MSRVWRQLELEAHNLSTEIEKLTGNTAMLLEQPEITRRSLLSLLDDLSGWTWDLEIACQQLQARRPSQAQAEKAIIFAFQRLRKQLAEWSAAWQ